MPVFGNDDLVIVDNCDLSESSWSCYGDRSFEVINVQQPKNYLAGSH